MMLPTGLSRRRKQKSRQSTIFADLGVDKRAQMQYNFKCSARDGFNVDRFPSGQREQTVNLPSQTSMVRIHPCPPYFSAGMAELADALDSGSSESNFMQVQVLFPAP